MYLKEVSCTDLREVVKEVFAQEMPLVLENCNSPAELSTYNNEYLQRNMSDYSKRFAAAEMKFFLDPNSKQEVLSLLTSIPGDSNPSVQVRTRANSFLYKTSFYNYSGFVMVIVSLFSKWMCVCVCCGHFDS